MSTCPHCAARLSDPASAICDRCGERLDTATAATLASFPPAGQATAEDDATEVMRRSLLEQFPGKRAPAYGTVDLAELGEALDQFLASEMATQNALDGPPVRHGAYDTRDGRPNGAGSDDDRATRDSDRQTADPNATKRSLTGAEMATARRVSRMWGTTVRPFDKPRHSLKGTLDALDSTPPESEISHANLVIHRRRLVSSPSRGGSPPDYELLDVLGEGGMGVVYAARQTSVDRTIALKMLKPKSASISEARGKFLAEAAVTGDLDHPNIVPIYDLGSNEDGSLFYAMKRVRGKPWLDVMADKSLDDNLQILLRVADAVAFAHDHGVIHRDLKPENVMLGDYGEVLVMDWGLAVGVDPSSKASSFTKVDSVGGTPAYMAPEMAGGPLANVGKHSDVYLLGGMLWEIVTGNTPHSGGTVMACLMAAGINALTPTTKRGELIDIALKAMATNPNDRYPTVQAFQEAIKSYQSHLQSIALAQQAQKYLESAKLSKKYDDFSRAAFGFEQALGFWSDNTVARQGRSTAQRMYAAAALENADLDLADSLLDRGDSTHAHLIPKVAEARAERERKQRQLRRQRTLLQSAVLAIIIVLGVSVYVVNGERLAADAARVKADESAKAAREAAKLEAEAKDAAILAQRKESEQRLAAEEAKKKAEEAQKLAEEAKKNEESAKIAAIAEKTAADAARSDAVKARDDAEHEGYVAKIGLAAAKIDQNSFLYAGDLLDDCDERLRRWEWGRIKYLLVRDDGSFAHKAPVEGAVYGPGAKTVFTGSIDGRATQWDVATKRPIREFLHGQPVWSIAVTADGSKLATGAADGTIKLWNVADGSLFAELTGHRDDVLALAFTKNGARLASASRDGTARIWDAVAKKAVIGLGGRNYGHGYYVWSVAWSPEDEKVLATAGEDGSVILWRVDRPMFAEDLEGLPELEPGSPLRDLPRGQKIAEYKGHGGPVSTAVFSPDGMNVISAGFDKDIHVWFAEIYRERTTLTPSPLLGRLNRKLSGHVNRVWSLKLSADGSRLASAGDDNVVRTWALQWGSTKAKLPNGKERDVPVCTAATAGDGFRGHSARIRSVDLSADDPRPLSGSDDGTAKLWKAGRFREFDDFATPHVVLTFAPSRDGKTVLAGCDDRGVRLLDAATKRELATLDEGARDAVTAIDVAPDGRRILGADASGFVCVWDAETRAELLSVQAHQADAQQGQPCAAAFSPDGRTILTGGADLFVRLWDAATGKLLREMKQHGAPVSVVAFSPDQKLLITGDRAGVILVHDAAKGGTAARYEAHSPTLPITGLAFFKDGTVISSSLDRSLSIWDPLTRKEKNKAPLAPPASVEAECGVLAMALSADERFALTGCEDGVVRLWDVKAEKLVKSLSGHSGPVMSVAFTPDGKGALTASLDRTLIRWDLETGKFQQTEPNLYRETTLLKFARNGERLLTADQDAVSWRTADGKLLFDVVRHALIENVAFAADGRRAVTAGTDAGVKIWDLDTKRVIGRLSETHAGLLRGMDVWPQAPVANVPAEELLIVTGGGDKFVRLWDGKKQSLVRELAGHAGAVTGVAFFGDGSRVASCSADGTARVWSAAGEPLLTLPKPGQAGHDGGLTTIAVSPDGKHLATAGLDQTIRIWNAETGDALFAIRGHTAGVSSLRFSPDAEGARLVSSSVDASVKVWDYARGKEVLTLLAHEQETTDAAFMPGDGLSVLSFGKDHRGIVWPAEPWKENVAPPATPNATARMDERSRDSVR